MIEFIVSIVAVYFIFRLLDHLFARRRPTKIQEGDFIRVIDGQYYIVRDAPATEKVEPGVGVPHQRRPNLKVVK